jgi:hypothetical protein
MDHLTHQVITKDSPENLHGGIMICGINFGYSVEDEALEKAGVVAEQELKSFFSDKTVNNTRFRNRVLAWLSSWGFEFVTQNGKEGAFERAFFQTNWLDTQTRSITSDGSITTNTLVQEADSFLRLLESRKPDVIVFVGGLMIEALNDIQIRQRVVSILGERSGNAKIYRAELPNYTGTRFKLLAQKFGETQIISLPHPQARGISDEYVAALKPPIHVIHKIIEKQMQNGRNHVSL